MQAERRRWARIEKSNGGKQSFLFKAHLEVVVGEKISLGAMDLEIPYKEGIILEHQGE